MNWHAATVPAEDLAQLLARIRSAGGTIAGSRPDLDGVHVTWTTAVSYPDDSPAPQPADGR